MIEIIKSTSKEFTPHLAVCDMVFNGGSANMENEPLVMKAKAYGDNLSVLLKQLNLSEVDGVITKASYRNTYNMLQAALNDKYNSDDDEPYYIWVSDFDTDTVIFEYKNKTYSLSYSLTTDEVVLLGNDEKEVIRQEVFVSNDGQALVLKSENENVNADVKEPPVDAEGGKQDEGVEPSVATEIENKEEDTMSDINVEELIQKAKDEAKEQARLEFEAELAEKELVKSAQTIVKGFGFIEEADVETLVKSMVALGDEMTVVVKALDSAKKAIDAIEAEKEEIKKEFGKQEAVDGKPELAAMDETEQLAMLVKQRKQAKAAANK